MCLSKNSWDEFSSNFNFDKYYKNELLNIILNPNNSSDRPKDPRKTTIWDRKLFSAELESRNLRVVNITTYKNELYG